MEFDDLVIGSGLAALGAVLGLLSQPGRRVGVLSGPADNRFLYYDDRSTVPCAFLGPGGLGSHWHGVIPMGWRNNFAKSGDEAFREMFCRFYPHAQLDGRLGRPGLFVPWRPVRPAHELEALARARGSDRLTLIAEPAVDLRFDELGVTVVAATGRHHARRTWVAAGALQTPALLGRSIAPRAPRGLVSDHVFCYVGQVDGQTRPRVEHTRDGVFFPAHYDRASTALYTLRPATFGFRRLDYGIEQRAMFGLPTGSAVAKIARRMSPGLLVEAFYNRFGLFGGTAMHSVYAQVAVSEAYILDADSPSRPLQARVDRIRFATESARDRQPFADLRRSRQPDTILPGIHLHHSVDLGALTQAGINTPDSPVQVVDGSVLTDIGPDHHAFKMMLSAFERATGKGLDTATAEAAVPCP